MRSRSAERLPPGGFDADAADDELARAVSAIDPPTFRRGGCLYVGRIISFEQWRRFEPGLRRWEAGELTEFQVRTLVYAYVAAVFPHPWWKVWRRSVAWMVISLPHVQQAKAMQRFLASQTPANAVWLGLEGPMNGPSTPPEGAAARPESPNPSR